MTFLFNGVNRVKKANHYRSDKVLRREGKSFRTIGKQLGISEGAARQRLKE
jgi:hypothetical protein